MNTPQIPVFTNSLIQELYTHDLRMSRELITEILELPRETLIEDLYKVLQDSMDRFRWFYNQDKWDETTQCFPLHALFLLKELQSTESLPMLLEVLRKGEEYLDYWYSDFLTDGMWEIIMVLGKDHPEVLLEFLKEPSVYPYVQSEVAVAMAEIALHDPSGREEVIDWFRKLLQYWLSDKASEKRTETELKGLVVCTLIDISAVELIPEVSELYEKKLAWPGVAGPLDHVRKALSRPLDLRRKRKLLNIFDKYDEIVKTWVTYTGESDED